MDTSRSQTTAAPAGPPAGREDAARTGRHESPGGAGQSVRQLKESAKQAAADATGQARQRGREMADRAASAVKQQASDLSRQACERGEPLLVGQKERAASVADDVAGAIHRAADKLRQDGDQNLAGYADTVADGAGSVAHYLRDKPPRAMVDDAADCTRRHPEWVLGGAYVVGLAIARFLKASRPDGAAYGSYRHDPGRNRSGSAIDAPAIPTTASGQSPAAGGGGPAGGIGCGATRGWLAGRFPQAAPPRSPPRPRRYRRCTNHGHP